MKKVTIKDIAKELGVTVGTVSHALNGMSDISEATKRRVIETAKRMGYVSNIAAASLRSGKTKTVAAIVPDISNPHIAYQIKLIEDKLKSLGYSVIILNTGEDENAERSAIELAYSKQVDGIMLCPAQKTSSSISFLESIAIPYLLIGRYFSDIDTDFICADDEKGGYLAGKYLVDKGYKKPIYIGAYKYIEASAKRFHGISSAFIENGTKLTNERFLEISPRADITKDSIRNLLDNAPDFDSIVAFSDVIAFEILSQLRAVGSGFVPVVGFDAINRHLSLPFRYASVGMTNGGWAEAAAEALLDKIQNKAKCKTLIDVELFESD